MPRTDAEIDELKSKLSLARKRPINFGFCLGRGGDGTVLLLHRRKSPDLLSRRAKKEGETQKLAAGQIRLKSRTVIMTCIDKPPPMMARQMRLYLRDFDLLFKVDIIEPGGDVTETEGTDDGTDAKHLLTPTTPQPNKRLEKWQRIEPIFDAAVARIVAADGSKASTIGKAWQSAKDAANNGKYKTALKVAKTIKPLIFTKPGAKTDLAPDDPDAAKWHKVEQKLETKLAAALVSSPANSDKMKRAFSAAQEKARAGDFKSASLIAKKLKPALDKVVANERADLPTFGPTYDTLAERLSAVGLAFNTVKLAKRLNGIRIDIERPPHDLDKALVELSEIDVALTVAANTWFTNTKSEASKALSIIKSYRGVSEQHARLAARLSKIDAAFRRSPPDYDEVAAVHAAIEADRAGLKRLSDRHTADRKEWLTKKKNWCDDPLSKLSDPVVKAEKARISRTLTQAKILLDSDDLMRAKRLITDAYWHIKAAEQLVADKAAFKALLTAAADALKSLTDQKLAFLDPEVQTLKQDLRTAADCAKKHDYYAARIILDPIPDHVADLINDAMKFADPAHLKALTERAEKLGQSPLSSQIQDQLSSATPAALAKGEALIATAESIAGRSPDKKDLRRLIKDPKALDDLLASIPEKATQELLAIRYGAEPAKSGALNPSLDLKALHNTLAGTSKPPTSRFKQVTRARDAKFTTSPGPMFHEGSSGDVYTSTYNPFSEKIGALNDRAQLGKIDADCVSTSKSTGNNPAYGRWSCLHQIGKAINTRKRFMQANGKKKVFGSWQDHGTDVSAIAQRVARHFKIDRVFVEQAMARKSPDIPLAPENVDAETWNAPYLAASNWVLDGHHDAALWNNDTRSAAHRIGSRVIHEASKGHWVSYEYSARSKGVTGTQFRSPGDWFAELYAAYLTNVMHPSHPARDWLVKL